MKTTFLLLFFGLALFASRSDAQPAFTDVTAQAGVANSLSGGGQRLATGLAWGDYDNDGDLDLYVTNWGQSLGPTVSVNRLYRNNGDGTFTDVAAAAGVADSRNSTAACWVDYDNDGFLDLYVVNFDDQDQLYHNNGNGTFTRVTASAGVNVISQGSETAAAWGDYDNDGFLDLYLCKDSFRNALYHNNGNGTFSEVAVPAGVADVRDSQYAAWGDYDNDGFLDLYVVNSEQNNALYHNNGNGTFSEVACDLSVDNTDVGQSAEWIDFNNDGNLDLYVANIGANALYRNDGSGRFVNVASGPLKNVAGAWISWFGAWGDFDADGFLDVFVATGAESRNGQVSPFLRGDGTGAFSDLTGEAGLSTAPESGVAAGAADFDNDGDLDLYVVNSQYPTFEANRLYRNDAVGVHTIKVRPRRKGAADGIGARVRLLLAGVLQGQRLISSGPDAQEALFGVQAGATYTVEVVFPGGATVTRTGVTAGTTVDIQQP